MTIWTSSFANWNSTTSAMPLHGSMMDHHHFEVWAKLFLRSVQDWYLNPSLDRTSGDWTLKHSTGFEFVDPDQGSRFEVVPMGLLDTSRQIP